MPLGKGAVIEVCTYADYEDLSRAAADLFERLADKAIRDRGRFDVVLSGGHTPIRTYELLAGRNRLDWGRVHVFWSDERCVPPEDPRSNAGIARKKFLDHVPIPPSQIHPIDCATSPVEGSRRYEALLRSLFGRDSHTFDLVFLGLGADGHTASLFPGTQAVRETDRWISEIYKEDEGIYRVSLTAPVINRSSVVAFMVSGASKAEMLRHILTGQPGSEKLPARLIDPNSYGGKLFWLVDKDAAILLES